MKISVQGRLKPVAGGQLAAPIMPTASIETAQKFVNAMADINDHVAKELAQQTATQASAAGLVAGQSPAFKSTQDPSIAGRAYDQAGIKTYLSQLEINTRTQLDKLYQQHRDDPAGLQKAIDAYAGGIRSHVAADIPSASQDIEEIIARTSRPMMLSAQDNHRKRLEQQSAATVMQALDSSRNSAERLARISEGTDQAAIDLTMERQDFIKKMLGNGPASEFTFRGTTVPADPSRIEVMTPDDMEKALEQFDVGVYGQRVMGGFDRAPNKQQYLDNWLRKERANTKSPLTMHEVDGLASQMRAEISREATMNNALHTELQRSVVDAEHVYNHGVTPSNIQQLRAQVKQFPDLVDRLDSAAADMHTAGAFAKMTPPAQEQALAKLQQDTAGTRRSVELRDRLEKIHAATVEGLKQDPVAYANQSGLVQIQPINLEDPASLHARGAVSDVIAAHYGIRTSGLTADETSQLSHRISQLDANGKIALFATLNQGMSDQRLELFTADIAKENPGFATAAAISKEAPATAREIVLGQDIMKNLKMAAAPAQTQLDTANDVIGAALQHNPKLQAQAMTAAMQLTAYRQSSAGELRGGSLGFDADVYGQALQDVLGGVVEFNDQKIVAPVRGMSQDQFDTLMSKLKDGDLQTEVKPGVTYGAYTGDGKPISADELRNDGTLESIGNGQYLVRYGNGYAMDAGGNPFELNLGQLAPKILTRAK